MQDLNSMALPQNTDQNMTLFCDFFHKTNTSHKEKRREYNSWIFMYMYIKFFPKKKASSKFIEPYFYFFFGRERRQGGWDHL